MHKNNGVRSNLTCPRTSFKERLYERKDEGYISGGTRSRHLRSSGSKERSSSMPRLLER